LVLYLLHYQLLPEQRLAALMADLFGVKLVTATIARISQDCAHRFMGFADAVRDHVAAAPVKHPRFRGGRLWMKPAFALAAKRSGCTSPRRSGSLSTACRRSGAACCQRSPALSCMITGSPLPSQGQAPFTMTGVLHALCNAHHLRELKALVEIEKEDWARKMQRLLRRACHVTNLAREQAVPLSSALIALLDRGYDAILAEGLAFHEAQPDCKACPCEGRGPGAAAVHRDGLAITCCCV
jgi:transposase